jgi:hypothetical protein
MNIKRLLLAIITATCLYTVFLALGQSFGEPQVQARLQLYQSNLILHAAQLKSETITDNQKEIAQNNRELIDLSKNLIGGNPYFLVETQYQEALDVTAKFIQKLEKTNLQPKVVTEVIDSDSPRKQLKEEITENKDFIKELNLKLGILQAQQNKINSALEKWENLEDNQTAIVLRNLWGKQPRILDNAIREINNNLEGWFRYQALKRVYTLKKDRNALLILENKEQTLAKKAISTLIALSIVPVLGGIIGFGLIVFLGIQRLVKKEEAILTTNNNLVWETPWNWEIIWQVLIVGFLFVSQIFIPLLFGILGFNPTNFSIRGKALYVLITYLLMSGSGILVLYLSLKSFFPLPQDWFKFKGGKSFLWGLGGYLIAIPSVFLVSIINQQLWDGQGGSNPLLFLALKAQDRVALAIFFVTASIAAPIFEEIMFRGFLLPSLTRYFPVSTAILVSALIFAFAHLSLAEILPLATLGLILGFVYTKSRSLVSSILVHSLWNSGTLFSLFILGSSLE